MTMVALTLVNMTAIQFPFYNGIKKKNRTCVSVKQLTQHCLRQYLEEKIFYQILFSEIEIITLLHY